MGETLPLSRAFSREEEAFCAAQGWMSKRMSSGGVKAKCQDARLHVSHRAVMMGALGNAVQGSSMDEHQWPMAYNSSAQLFVEGNKSTGQFSMRDIEGMRRAVGGR